MSLTHGDPLHLLDSHVDEWQPGRKSGVVDVVQRVRVLEAQSSARWRSAWSPAASWHDSRSKAQTDRRGHSRSAEHHDQAAPRPEVPSAEGEEDEDGDEHDDEDQVGDLGQELTASVRPLGTQQI